ncbi:YdbC family protein [Thalassobacillus hwangdonensis]|uniref:YdbC family protein n=1 Tax=Thalassobacillus hwangdonensis TaxID=546108 RepID=A0ABW3L4E9_9BACI
MIIKRIICNVRPEQRQDFSEAQQKWEKLRDVDGFIGQIGGWCKEDESCAYIVALWNSREEYDAFMENEHDAIYEAGQQADTFEEITIDLFDAVVEPLRDIEAEAISIHEGLLPFLGGGDLVGYHMDDKRRYIIISWHQGPGDVLVQLEDAWRVSNGHHESKEFSD